MMNLLTGPPLFKVGGWGCGTGTKQFGAWRRCIVRLR